MSTISHWQHYLPSVAEWTRYIERDIANMEKVRFNSLAAHVDWYDIETADGRFEFERLDKLMDLAEAHGLKVLLWPWPELQPEWVPQVHPDSEMIASDGYRPTMSCWDHPRVRGLVERFVRRVVERYRNRSSLLAWDLGAEAGMWVSSINNPVDQARTSRLYCYCDHTVKRYREWIRDKYGSIDRLNEVWATHYNDWSQVKPIRTGIFERAQIFWVDWREFMLWNVAEFQKLKADTARRADPAHPITAHMGSWGGAYVYGSTDEYRIGKHFDVLSLSYFPYWLQYGHGTFEPAFGAIHLDGVRSAGNGKPMWVEELQGGPSINGLAYRSPFPRPQDIRVWVWQSVAHGATGIFYWNWRPETTGVEAGGFGLVNYDGSLTDRVRAAGEVCEVLQKHARLFNQARPSPAQIAIFHDPRISIHAYGDGDEGMYIRSVRGVYRAMWRSCLPVDFVVPEQLLAADLSRYKIIYLPFAYMLSPQVATKLKSYVEAGGTLFADMWCGLKDDRTFLYETVPGGGLAELFHCKEVQTNPRTGAALKITRKHEALAPLDVGAAVPVYKWQQQLTLLEGAEVLAQLDDGNPAIVCAKYGQGRTFYVAAPVARVFDESLDGNAMKLLTGVATWASVRPPIEFQRQPADAPAEVRVLQAADGRRVAIALNHSQAVATLSLSLPDSPAMKISDLVTGKELDVGHEGNSLKLSLDLPASEVRVLLLEPRAR